MNISPLINHIDFSDWSEKLNEKTSLWMKKWLVMDNNRIYFFDKRPVNEFEMSKPKEAFIIDNCYVKSYREFKTKNLVHKKNFVVQITSLNVNISIALKNEKSMTRVFELVCILKSNRAMDLMTKSPLKKENQNHPSHKTLQFSSNKKFEDSSVCFYKTFREGGVIKKEAKVIANKPERKHYKHKSCGDNEMINYLTENPKKSTSSIHAADLDKKSNNSNNGSSAYVYHPVNQKLNEARHNSKLSSNFTNIDKNSKMSRNKGEDRLSSNTHQFCPIKNSSQIGNNKEENLPLQKMITNMITGLSAKKMKGKATDSFINYYHQDDFDNSDIPSANHNENTKNSSSVINSRKKQISKIIKLSFPNTERSDCSSSIKPNKLNFDQSPFKGKGQCKEDKDNPSSTFIFNLSQEEMSFDEKDKFKGSNQAEKVNAICFKLDNFEEYFFDSSILKRIVKSYGLSKQDIGLIFNQSEKEYIKSQMLTEMLSHLSKKFLEESVLKSLEIILREKDMNKRFFIGSSHQHSIEYCIVDIFNTFLGNNSKSEELFVKILPGYLVENYNINFLLNIKNQISIPNLFVLMQNHNKIFFNDNIDINFNDKTPFVVQDIRYISPYNVNKWYSLAMDWTMKNTGMFLNNERSEGESGNLCTTNVKRMKYRNFEMKETFDKMLSQLKKSEKDSEDLRINLIKNIYFHIFNKRNELALKLCDFYVQKFNETIFLNPIVYLVLAEIYNETLGLDLAKLFYEKAVNILNWQFPNQTNPLLIDLNYTYSLILMKQSVNLLAGLEVEDHQDEENSTNSESDKNYKEIKELLDKSKELCDKFFDCENEKRVKIVLQSSLIKLSHSEFNLQYSDSFNTENVIAEILKSLDFLNKQEKFKEEIIYLNLFIDIMKNMTNVEDEIKIKFIQRLHEVKKITKIKSN